MASGRSTKFKWIRTSRLSIKNSLSLELRVEGLGVTGRAITPRGKALEGRAEVGLARALPW